MTCGNNITVSEGIYPECGRCQTKTIMAIVPEDNWDGLPFPTDPPNKEIDFNDPSKNCQCRAGTCPCGKFVAHRIDEPCNSHELLALKENE
jgi:hypothetical protein